MLKSSDIRRQAVQRLKELFPKAQGWEEHADTRIGGQGADLVLKFRLGGQEHVFVLEVSSLGQPRQIGRHQCEQRFPGEHQDRDCGQAAGERQQNTLGQ